MRTMLILSPWALALAVLAGVLVSCSASRPVDRERAWSGPQVRMEPQAGEQHVVAQLPNPGWSIRIDEIERRGGIDVVYVSLRQPDPERVYTQQIVEKRIATGIQPQRQTELLARIVSYDGEPQGPYAPAGG